MRVLLLVILATLMFSVSLTAETKFGVGAQAGLDYPVAQDDQGQGTVFILKGFWSFAGILSVEPNVSFGKFGDPEFSDEPGLFDGLEGSKVTAYGINALLGANFGTPGFHPYGLFGVGLYSMKRDQTFQDISELGWTGGLGIELGFTGNLAADARGRVNVIPLEEGGSKKSLAATVGVNYYFGSK